MEQEMNDNQNQQEQGSWPKPEEEKSFFQQEGLQKTWLNVKLATWIKCLVISIVLSVAAVFIAPAFSPAHTQTQGDDYDYYCEYEDDWYDDSGDSWYDEYEYYDEYDEDGWYDDYEYEDDWSYDYEEDTSYYDYYYGD